MLAKSKALLAALKFGKLATTFGSMFVSIAVYAAIYSWKFAVGFVGLIFVHEMGHVLALKRRGIPIEGMFFIPFLGAAVSFKKRPADPAVDAEISAAGPLAGWLGGLVCAAIYAQNGEPFWLVMAHVTFLINLINLAPATPLDGGWIVRAINPKFSLVGAAIGAAIGFYMHSTIFGRGGGFGRHQLRQNFHVWRRRHLQKTSVARRPHARDGDVSRTAHCARRQLGPDDTRAPSRA